MSRYSYLEDNDNKRKGLWLSFILHILILFILFLPFFKGEKEDPDQLQGITVALGDPSVMQQRQIVKASVPSSAKSSQKISNEKKAAKKITPVKSSAPVVSKTTLDNSEVVATEKETERKNEAMKIEKERKELEAKERAAEKARAEAAEKKRAEEEAAKLAEERSKAKSKFSSLFKSKQENGESSKGQKNGKPNAKALDNLSSGSGKIGTGLGSRDLLHAPTIIDNTQKTGRVIVNICVNSAGKVIAAKFRQKGSTTTDAHLVGLAEKSAGQYVFSKSKVEEQCGDIIIDFKLK